MYIRTARYFWYYYDLDGIRGVEVDGNFYTYVKSTFGDVIGIVDSNGNLIGGYKYDMWGNCTVSTGGNNMVVVNNPFRYRGYYYDTDMEMYYLKTRYYDQNIGRFISSDNPEILVYLFGTTGSLNLYAYCFNNPINNTDENGQSAIGTIILWAIIGGALGAGFGAINASIEGRDVIESAVVGGVIGAIGGALSGMTGKTSSFLSVLAGGMGTSFLEQLYYSRGNITETNFASLMLIEIFSAFLPDTISSEIAIKSLKSLNLLIKAAYKDISNNIAKNRNESYFYKDTKPPQERLTNSFAYALKTSFYYVL